MNTSPNQLLRDVPILRLTDPVGDAIWKILATGVPALPVADDAGVLYGIFGEREFIEALFPGYIGQLKYAGFVPQSLDTEIERRAGCLAEGVARYMNVDHIDVGEDYSHAQIAETFLHHRVLIVPVVDRERRVQGIVTRTDFFAALAGWVADAETDG
jgi:CBS domain-containing protein